MQNDIPVECVERYAEGYGPVALTGMAARRAEAAAAFFLPYLRSGMTVLDCGCGPGTITVGLAASTAPALAIGTDVHGDQFDVGRRWAEEVAVGNVEFQVANVYELPFEDARFDRVFVHALLGNLQRPDTAMREIARVLKPGGLVGAREFDFGASVVMPDNKTLHSGWHLRKRVRATNGQNPSIGRHLPALFHAAGLRCRAAAPVFEYADDADSLQQCGRLFADLFEESYSAVAIERGWVDRAKVDEILDAWRNLANYPGAFLAQAWVEAVGEKF